MWCFAYQKEEKTKNEITERNILLVFVIYKDIWCISIYLTNFPLTCFRLHTRSMISREGLWTTLSWSFWLILQRSGHYSTCSVPTIIYSVTFVIVTLYHIMLSVQWGNILLSRLQHKFLHDSWEEEEDTVIFEIYVLF